MRLQELLNRHPNVALATAADNEDILSFFNSLPMTGKTIDLQYDRSPDFFHFLNLHSEDSFVFLLRDKGTLQGVGTLVLRRGVIKGTETSVGYLGDLRVKPGKRNAVNWRNFYQDLIQSAPKIDDLIYTRFFSTVVIDSNKAAQNSLVSSNKNTFHYHLLDRYDMINVYFKKPLPFKSKYEVRFATESDLTTLAEYYSASEMKKPFGFPALLSYALKTWPAFSVDKFVLVTDHDKIIAMAGLWSPTPVKKIFIRKLSLPLKLMGMFLKLRKNGFPSLGEELKPLYLTHLNFNNAEALSSIIDFTLKTPLYRNYHMLSFTQFSLSHSESALTPFVCDKLPMALYQVHDNDIPALNDKWVPGFEMALV